MACLGAETNGRVVVGRIARWGFGYGDVREVELKREEVEGMSQQSNGRGDLAR